MQIANPCSKLEIQIHSQDWTNLIFACTDFCAHKIVFCARSLNNVCIKQSLSAQILIV